METQQNRLKKLFPTGLTHFVTIALALFIAFTLSSCGDSASSTATTDEDTTEETATTEETTGGDSFAMTPEDIEALKAKFTVDESGYYYHNYWGKRWPQRRTLKAVVNQTGYYYLSSVYFGEKAPNHNRIIVKVGDQSMNSDRVKLNSDDHQTQKDGSKKYEVNNYTNYRDKGIFEAIGKAPEGTEVSIRFDGPDSYSEAPMSANDFTAVKECYQLSLVLRMEAAAAGAN